MQQLLFRNVLCLLAEKWSRLYPISRNCQVRCDSGEDAQGGMQGARCCCQEWWWGDWGLHHHPTLVLLKRDTWARGGTQPDRPSKGQMKRLPHTWAKGWAQGGGTMLGKASVWPWREWGAPDEPSRTACELISVARWPLGASNGWGHPSQDEGRLPAEIAAQRTGCRRPAPRAGLISWQPRCRLGEVVLGLLAERLFWWKRKFSLLKNLESGNEPWGYHGNPSLSCTTAGDTATASPGLR